MAFGLIIKKLRLDVPISVDKLAEKVGVNAGRWRKWEEKDLNPRHDDALKIEEFFHMDIQKVQELKSIKEFLKVPHETGSKSIKYKPADLTLAMLLNLTESNKLLAESNVILARTQEDLATQVKEKRKVTENVDGRILLDVQATLLGVREYVAELAAEVRKTSIQESAAVLGTKLVRARKSFEKKGNRIDGNK
ncbi:MAG TPA: helix-turn-helix transcriptional regulator [Chryseolinea sp.]|nr:helix-turn-helix transcriptional regulator [Chryseolinea sp.]